MMPLPIEDIILPGEPGFWPPAPGWWLLALILLVALLRIIRRLWRGWPRWRARRRALGAIRRAHNAAEINRLLKGYAVRWLAAPPAAQGDAWVQWMLQQGPALPPEDREVLKQLAEAPYRPDGIPDPEQLKRAVIHWIRKVKA